MNTTNDFPTLLLGASLIGNFVQNRTIDEVREKNQNLYASFIASNSDGDNEIYGELLISLRLEREAVATLGEEYTSLQIMYLAELARADQNHDHSTNAIVLENHITSLESQILGLTATIADRDARIVDLNAANDTAELIQNLRDQITALGG